MKRSDIMVVKIERTFSFDENILNEYCFLEKFNYRKSNYGDWVIDINSIDDILEVMKMAKTELVIKDIYENYPFTIEIYDDYRE
jgi:hypothetical protein